MNMNLFRLLPTLIVLYLTLVLSGCATTCATTLPEEPAQHTAAEFSDDEQIIDISDPWERFNLSMYRFNYNLDRYLLLPLVEGYEFITPTVVQTGVHNFFGNIGEFRTFYNSLFQGKGTKALVTMGRFVTNTTLGIAGLFDPATSFGLERQQEDFGQTLGVWGVDTGPYLVLPMLGPNTVRSAGGFAVDTGIRTGIMAAIDPYKNMDDGTALAIQAGTQTLEIIDIRKNTKFHYNRSGNPFEYILVRYLSTKKLEMEVLK